MRVAFATDFPYIETKSRGGKLYYMVQTLRSVSDSFEYIQTDTCHWPDYHNDWRDGMAELKRIGRELSKRLCQSESEIVICRGSAMIPFLETDKRLVLWHDSTWFSLMQMEFAEFKDRHPLLYEWDRLTLQKCDAIAFAADWVRDHALRFYGCAPEKTHVVPFGANVDAIPEDAADRFIEGREVDPCRLAFLAVDWRLKRLPLAYEVMTRLNRQGVPAQLYVVGCTVPGIGPWRWVKHLAGVRHFGDTERFQLRFGRDPNVKRIGFLRRDDPSQTTALYDILRSTHFLLHPASFDAYGKAMAEANAFGVPVLATDNHGAATIVRNGVNGHRFSYDEYVEGSVEFIQRHMMNYDKYISLARSSYAEYRDRLNWSTSVARLKELLADI